MSNQYTGMTHAAIIAAVAADGVVDASEVADLRDYIWDDGEVDRDEVELVAAINDAVSGNANDASWAQLYSDVLYANIMDDGVVDDEEVEWVTGLVNADGQVDDVERAALNRLGITV